MLFLILLLALFFAVNMGGASFAASFATPYGSKIITRHKARLLFLIFVILGSVLFGKNVAITLGQEIVPSEFITYKALVIIFLSAGLSMFIANLMNIPQSTSLVTVAAIAGVGAFYKNLNMAEIYYLLPFWVILPILSYFLTYGITGYIYPPRKSNYWIYERFVNHEYKLKKFVILCACYNAFSVGTNNVANVVGPFIGFDFFKIVTGLAVFALFYGSGAFIFTGALKTAGEKIVPLGLLTASIISIVSGTLIIIASALGIPQSFVMLQMGAVFAVSTLKHGGEVTFQNPLTRKTLYTWTINPILTFLLSLGLCYIIL